MFQPVVFDVAGTVCEKLYKINKKIIALNGFDDYYNKFACKGLYKELPKLNFELIGICYANNRNGQ
jgi:hypothetical protein